MNDKYREHLIDQYEDAIIALLIDEYAEAEGARLLSEFEDAEKNGSIPDIPVDLDIKCKQLIQKTFAKQSWSDYIRHITKKTVKAAALILVFVGLATTTVLSVDALRIPVVNFFLQNSGRYTAIGFDEQNYELDQKAELLDQSIRALIPEDYELISQNIEDYGSIFLLYQNAESHFLSVDISPSQGQMRIDTEDAEQETISINNYEAILIKKNGLRVIWIDVEQQFVYDVYTNHLMQDIFWEIVYKLAS